VLDSGQPTEPYRDNKNVMSSRAENLRPGIDEAGIRKDLS